MSMDFILAAGGGHGPALLNGASPLLLTAVIIIVGGVAGVIAHKFKLPALTGQIIYHRNCALCGQIKIGIKAGQTSGAKWCCVGMAVHP